MNKKILFTLSLLSIVVFLSGCGGGGGGSISAPPGTDPGVPAVVRLAASQYVAQTGSTIDLRAKVLDGNGRILQGVTVNFTNISLPLIGTLSAASAITDKYGVAKITITSPAAGLATVVASVSALSDRNTVQFSSSLSLSATMSLAVNSVPGNATYDELSDYTLFEPLPVVQPDNTVTILATVLNGDGTPASGKSITWGADNSRVVITPLTSTTNAEGKANVSVNVTSSILDAEIFVTVFATASNGASNMKTLFLKPVTISSSTSSLSANPTRITPNGSSALTAVVKLNTGAAAPDETTVNFTTTCGTVTPFAPTAGGVAKGTFTGPVSEGTCSVTATAAGVTLGSSVNILVTSQLVVIPSSVSIAVGDAATVTVFGGIPNYTIISGSPTIATVSPTPLTASGQAFTVTGVAQGSATITVRDSTGTSVTVTATVSTSGGGGGGTTLGIMPGSVTVAGIKNPDSNDVDNATFVLTGDIAGLANCISSNPSIIASPGLHSFLSNAFEIDPDEVTATTIVTITCTDEGGFTATATVTVDPPGLTIRVNPIHVIGRANPAGGDGDITDDVLVEVVGGVPPYIVNIEPFSLSTIVPGGPWSHTTAAPWTFLVDPTNVLTNTVVTFEVTDNLGATANATLVVYTENTGLVASTDKENVIGLANPDVDTADDVTISVAGANNPFIVSWVCAIAATPASPVVVAGTSGTVIFDPDKNTGTTPTACTVNVTDNLGSAATLNVTVWP